MAFSPATGMQDDLSTLAWVYDELRRSLEAAHKALHRYLKEAEAAGASDVEGVDPAVLRQARAQVHQSVGALELVGLGVAAQPLRAAEAALVRLAGKPRLITPAAIRTIEQGSFALLDFLSRRLAGKDVSPLAMFPQYRALQELAGATRVHPADLWSREWQWQEVPADPSAAPRDADAAAVTQAEGLLLPLMRGAAPTAAAQMSDLFAGLGANAEARLSTLWKLAAAFFEAVSGGLLPVDVYGKRVGSRLLAQLRAGQQAEASDRLSQDLLFFCAQAAGGEGRTPGPRLAAVRQAFGLAHETPVDYEVPRLGRFDPALITQARKRVAAAKENWSAVAAGELAHLTGLTDPFSLVGDSLQRLYANGATLAQALQGAASQTVASGAEPSPELAMEVATALLYVDASLEDGDFDHPDMAQRVQRLAQRIEDVRAGRQPGSLERWMEDLYRRVSDRQTMGSVVQELRASLSEIEKQIDQYFRNPAQRELLMPVPAQLQAMRGVLSVLGMDQASQAVLRMRDDVDTLASTEIDPARTTPPEVFNHLADNLGALSFLIDMVSVQPHMAKSLFRFDPASGRLTAVVARAERAGEPFEMEARADDTPTLIEQAQTLVAAASQSDADREQITAELERLSHQARAADQAELAEAAHRAQTALAEGTGSEGLDQAGKQLAETLSEIASPAHLELPAPPEPARPVPPPGPPAAPGETGLEEDAEMREIFLEEAREVIEGARGALVELQDKPDAAAAMTTVRRAFHTLKGSSRMVGLNEFGEAAWACEQLFNARLAESAPADGDLRGFTAEVLDHFEQWVDAISGGQATAFRHPPVTRCADALRVERHWISLANALAEAAAPVAEPAPVFVVPDFAEAAPPAVEHTPAAEPVEAPAEEPALVLQLQESAAMAEVQAETEAPTLAASLEAMVPDLPEAAELDLAALAPELALPAEAAPPATVEQPVAVEPPSFESTAFDMALPERIDLEPAAAELPLSMPLIDIDFGEPAPQAEPALQAPETSAPAATQETVITPDAAFDLIELDLPAVETPELVQVHAPVEAEPAVELPPPLDLTETIAAEGAVLEALPDEALRIDLQPEEPAQEPLAEAAAEALPVSEEVAPAEPEPLHPAAPEVPAESPAEPVATGGEGEAEQVKVIGDLRISIPLFNIYLNEADELSRRLSTELAEWLHEPYRPVGDAAIAFAHSLAGSSATVGYGELSQLARSLEHCLARSNDRGQARGQETALFHQAADEIRRLLHQFAAGFLRTADPQLMESLAALEHAPVEPLPMQELAPEEPGPQEPAEVAVPTSFGDLGQPALMPFVALQPAPERHVPVRADALDTDDDIDATDAIDDELFPIFEEEGHELIPQLQARLRDWMRRPGDAAAAAACMRTLHTLKGGARLAGAMRLGEMAHRLETAIEHLSASGHPHAEDIESLVARADAIEVQFEVLRRGGEGVAPMAPTVAELPTPEPALPAEPAALGVVLPELLPAVAPAPQPVEAAQAPLSATPEAVAAEAAPAARREIDWARFDRTAVAATATDAQRASTGAHTAAVRVRAPLLDRLVNHAGEVSITRARIESDMGQIKGSLSDLTDNLERLRSQLRDIELQAETQIGSRMEAARAAALEFDPLEMDRFTRFQEITRMMAESVNDVATIQRGLQRTLQSAEDELAIQARLTRDLQDDLLRTRMVEFEGLSERLYRVVRQAGKETGKHVRLDIVGGSIEIDRGVLDRMTGSFEHLLRNSVVHGIESPEARSAAGKEPTGSIVVTVTQEGNEVAVDFRDDGAGLNLPRIRARAIAMGLLTPDAPASDAELAAMIFHPGFSTAETVTGLAGRGVGMDVVRADVNAMGGRIETATAAGQGTSFRLVLPLTTAVTQVVMLRCAALIVAVPATLVEIVRRAPVAELEQAYHSGSYRWENHDVPFFWLGALLQGTAFGQASGKTAPVVIVRSASQRVVLHVDEVVGNQEVVVKNLGPQLSRLPGLTGMTLLPSGQPALIYNPVALATLYGSSARAATVAAIAAARREAERHVEQEEVAQAPLVLVVDDSLTVRRVTQRLLVREGYRVALAKDGLEGLERLAEELPAVVLSDIEMPRMDGFDLVRNMRVDPRLKNLPVIMITSRIAQKHRDYAAELGVNHYLGKPFAEDELLALVANYAGRVVHA